MFELKKIGFVKRASALLLDAILLAVLATGFIWIISLICDFKHKQDIGSEYFSELESFRDDNLAELAKYYGYDYVEGDEGNYSLTTSDGKPASIDDVMDKLFRSKGEDPETAELYKTYVSLLQKCNVQLQLILTMLFMMVSVGVLLSYIVLEFILPIILKNGQTVGKKVFSVCLVQPNCVKISNLSLFARTFIGKFAIETMFPILLVFLFLFGRLGWLAIVLFLAITLLNVIVFFVSKNRTPIHDVIAGTVTVDKSLQMIYNSEQEIVDKKALLQNDNDSTF